MHAWGILGETHSKRIVSMVRWRNRSTKPMSEVTTKLDTLVWGGGDGLKLYLLYFDPRFLPPLKLFYAS